MKSVSSVKVPAPRITVFAEVLTNSGLVALSLLSYQQLAAPACTGQLHTLPDDSWVLPGYPCNGWPAQKVLYILLKAPLVLRDMCRLERTDAWCTRATIAFILRLAAALVLPLHTYSTVVSPLIVYFLRADIVVYHLLLGPTHQPSELALRALFGSYPIFDFGYFTLLLNGAWRIRPLLELAHCALMAGGLLVLSTWHRDKVPGGLNIAWQMATRLAVPCATLYLTRRLAAGRRAAAAACAGPGPGGRTDRLAPAGSKAGPATGSSKDGGYTPQDGGSACSSYTDLGYASEQASSSGWRPTFWKRRWEQQQQKPREEEQQQEHQDCDGVGPFMAGAGAPAAPTPMPQLRGEGKAEDERRPLQPTPQLLRGGKQEHRLQGWQQEGAVLGGRKLGAPETAGAAAAAGDASAAIGPADVSLAPQPPVDGPLASLPDIAAPLPAPYGGPPPPRYRPFVRRHTCYYKIPWAEPEQLGPGYEERLRQLVAAQGYQLANVYVRRGCIELTLILEEQVVPKEGEQQQEERTSPQLDVAAVVRALGLMHILTAPSAAAAAPAADPGADGGGGSSSSSSSALVALRLSQVLVRSWEMGETGVVAGQEAAEVMGVEATGEQLPAARGSRRSSGVVQCGAAASLNGGGSGKQAGKCVESLLLLGPSTGLGTAG